MFSLEFDQDFRFKVYAEETGKWYGVESLQSDTELAYTTDDHGNIHLKRGAYLVTFDPETQTVTVTEA